MRLSSLLIVLGVVLIASAVFSGCKRQTVAPEIQQLPKFSKLKLGEKTYSIELARTPQELQQGLSDRDQIGSDGMLFVFSSKGRPIFWMIDMRFDLDFIWIADGKIVEIQENIPKPQPGQTPSQLPRYSPKEQVDMILEVEAGFVKREGVAVGDGVKIVGL